MSQKVHPYAFRLGTLRNWGSRWFVRPNSEYKKYLHQDFKIRKFLFAKGENAGIARIDIQRAAGQVTVIVYTSRPGILIGHSGANIDKLRDQLRAEFSGMNFDVKIVEIRKPDLEAALVAESIARQIEKRISYRRAARAAAQRSMEQGAKGIKVIISGRLNGAEIARRESYKEGTIPLHTIRADIDFAIKAAHTAYGSIGVKVWIYRGLVFGKQYLHEPEFVTPGKDLRGGSIIVGARR